MLTPALDAVDEHIYLNIGASLGTGSGTSRLNATGITNIGTWLNSNKAYSLITNKKHRILHIVGGGSGIDNRAGDAGTPWTNTDEDYFYDIYYESDQRHSALGLAVKHARVYNLKTIRLSMGSTDADAHHDYISPDIESNETSTATMLLASNGGGGATVKGELHFYNPKIVFINTGGRLFDCAATNHINFSVFGGCIYAGNYSNTQYFITVLSSCGLVAKFYNVAFYKTGLVNRFVAYNAGYVEGTKAPSFAMYNLGTNATSFDAAANFTTTDNIYGQGIDDLFVDGVGGNYLIPSISPMIGAGLDLTTVPDYASTDYDSWDVGLLVAAPLPGALQINTMTSASGSKVFKPNELITIGVTGDIGVTAGTGVVKNYSGAWEAELTINSWDNTTKVITATLPVDADFRYADDDNIVYLERSDTEAFNPFTAVTVLAPDGVAVINGDSPSSADNSVFKDAISPPSGMYQVRWRDPDATGAVINSFGEVVSSTGFGTIFVSVWDSADNTTSGEYEFEITSGGSVVPPGGLTVRGLTVTGLSVSGLSVRGL